MWNFKNNYTKEYNRESVTVYVNDMPFVCFCEEGNLEKNEKDADDLINLFVYLSEFTTTDRLIFHL